MVQSYWLTLDHVELNMYFQSYHWRLEINNATAKLVEREKWSEKG